MTLEPVYSRLFLLKFMKPEYQRVTIAEACGWAYDPELLLDYPWFDREGEGHRHLPDYLNDLNAMQEVENTLSEEQRLIYSEELYHTAIKCQKETGLWRYLSASAAQRAEAFLKTLNLWDNNK